MCTGLEPLLIGAGASAGTAALGATALGYTGAALAAKGMIDAKNAPGKAANAANRARAQAEADAITGANSKIKLGRQAMRDNSLLTGGGGGQQTLGV